MIFLFYFILFYFFFCEKDYFLLMALYAALILFS